jgi:hypothetical protein
MTNDDAKIFLPTKLPPPHFVMVGNGHAIPSHHLVTPRLGHLQD